MLYKNDYVCPKCGRKLKIIEELLTIAFGKCKKCDRIWTIEKIIDEKHELLNKLKKKYKEN